MQLAARRPAARSTGSDRCGPAPSAGRRPPLGARARCARRTSVGWAVITGLTSGGPAGAAMLVGAEPGVDQRRRARAAMLPGCGADPASAVLAPAAVVVHVLGHVGQRARTGRRPARRAGRRRSSMPSRTPSRAAATSSPAPAPVHRGAADPLDEVEDGRRRCRPARRRRAPGRAGGCRRPARGPWSRRRDRRRARQGRGGSPRSGERTGATRREVPFRNGLRTVGHATGSAGDRGRNFGRRSICHPARPL